LDGSKSTEGPDDAADTNLLKPSYRRLFIATMFTVCLFNFADRAVFAVLAQSIKLDLKLTDFELGLLQGLSFALLYAVLGLPIGRLAERKSRIRIVAAATAVWSAMTVACGFAGNFFQMMLARIGVGVGEAGFMPPTSSLVSDHFPANRRASAMSLIMMGTPAGLFVGSWVAGAAAQAWDWRAAFWVLGAPGLAVAVLVVAFLREPSRGLVDNAPKNPSPPPDFGAFLKAVLRKRALSRVIIGGGLAGFGMTSIAQFLAVYLSRVFDMPVREAGAYYGTISGVALALGLLIGSFGTDWLSRKDSRWPAWGAAIGLATAPFLYMLAFSARDQLVASFLLVIAGASLLIFYGPTVGMIQNCLEPRMRASGAALFAMLYTVFGAGLGPVFVGFASDRFAAAAFDAGAFFEMCPGGVAAAGAAPVLAAECAAASASGIQQALYLAVCIFFVAAGFYYWASRTLADDFHAPPAKEISPAPGLAPQAKAPAQ
jgi:predicted MFS family arabinose efflux permease